MCVQVTKTANRFEISSLLEKILLKQIRWCLTFVGLYIIITFLTKVCHHHHLSGTSASYYHFLALSLVISPPFDFHNYIIYFNNDFHLRCFLICCVVLQVVYHVLTVGVLNNLRVKWYIWKFPSAKMFLYFYTFNV